MTSGSASAAAVSLGNNEALHHKQTVAQIRAGGGGRGADVTSVAPANEVAALSNFSLDTTVAASANGEGRRLRRERSSLCRAKKSEGIEGWVSDEKVARP